MSEFSCDCKKPFNFIENYTDLMGNASTTDVRDATATAEQSAVDGRLAVWYANIDDIESVEEDHPLIRSLLPDEKLKVKRFKFADDQKRALLSILLQRMLIRTLFNTVDVNYELCRSREVWIA